MRSLILITLALTVGCAARAQTGSTQPPAAPPVKPAEPVPTTSASVAAQPPVVDRSEGPKDVKPSPQSGTSKREPAQPFADKEKKSKFKLDFPMDHVRRLEGKWKTEAVGETPEQQMKVIRAAGGSAMMEHLFPDKDNDSVGLYTAVNGEIVLTHFSYLDSVPRLRAKTGGEGWKPGELNFVLEGGLRVPEGGRYLKSLRIEFVDDDTVKYHVQFVDNGKDFEPGTLVFRRELVQVPAAPAPVAAPQPATPADSMNK
ncbi:MAG: hypothetical protein ACT4PL_08190 [Phycisphaerales bacterium]